MATHDSAPGDTQPTNEQPPTDDPQSFDGEPHYGEHGGGERRGHGEGGQAKYGDLSYQNPGYDTPTFTGNYGTQSRLHGQPRDFSGQSVEDPLRAEAPLGEGNVKKPADDSLAAADLTKAPPNKPR